jgi:hypothetical protein
MKWKPEDAYDGLQERINRILRKHENERNFKYGSEKRYNNLAKSR